MSQELTRKLIQSFSDVELAAMADALKTEQAAREEKKEEASRPWTNAEWKKLIKLREKIEKYLGDTIDVSVEQSFKCTVSCSIVWTYDGDGAPFYWKEIIGPEIDEVNFDALPEVNFDALPEVQKSVTKMEAMVLTYENEVRRVAKKYGIDFSQIADTVEQAM